MNILYILKKILFLSIFLLPFFSGCQSVRYVFIPPLTDGGKMCTAECTKIRNECELEAQKDYQECQRRYDFENRIYLDCLRESRWEKPIYRCINDGSKRFFACQEQFEAQMHFYRMKKSIICNSPSYCYPNDSICENNYRQCFEGCGGTVIKEIIEK